VSDGHGGQVAASAASLGCAIDEMLDLSSTLNHFGPDIVPIVATIGQHAVHRDLDARETDAGGVLVDAGACLVEPLFRRRILVRELNNYGLPGQVRIAVPNGEGLERLASALDEIEPGR
jgi:hypothetical protein